MKKTLFCLKFSPKNLYYTKNNLLRKPLFSKEPARGPVGLKLGDFCMPIISL